MEGRWDPSVWTVNTRLDLPGSSEFSHGAGNLSPIAWLIFGLIMNSLSSFAEFSVSRTTIHWESLIAPHQKNSLARSANAVPLHLTLMYGFELLNSIRWYHEERYTVPLVLSASMGAVRTVRYLRSGWPHGSDSQCIWITRRSAVGPINLTKSISKSFSTSETLR